MTMLTKKDFSDLCGIRTKMLSVYIQRGKVVTDGDMINDENEINRAFKTKRLNSPKKIQIIPGLPEKLVPSHEKEKYTSILPTHKSVKNIENEAFSRQNTTPSSMQTDRALKKMDIDYEKKQKEIERLDQEMRLARLQEEKLLGKLIPTDMVKNLFAQHFKSVTLTFKQAADLIAVEFGKKAKIARNDQAELRGQLVTIINRAIEDSISESKRSLTHIVHEYSQTRK